MWPFGFWDKYPDTNFHELNADWILAKIRGLEGAVSSFIKNWSSPKTVSSYQDFTDPKLIYLYTGDEVGYNKNHWYYYEDGEWKDGGLFGSAVIDDSLSDTSVNAVQNKVITEKITDIEEQMQREVNITNPLLRTINVEQYPTIPSGYWLGGVCYDSLRGRFVFGFGNDTNTSILYTPGFVPSTVIIGHVNDLTYDPVNDIIISTNSNTVDGLTAIDPVTLSVDHAIPVDIGGTIAGQVSLDSNNDILAIGAGGMLYLYKYSTMELTKTININDTRNSAAIKESSSSIVRQSGLLKDNLFYLLLDIQPRSAFNERHYIMVYDIELDIITNAYCYEPYSGMEETESIVFYNDVFYLYSAIGEKIIITHELNPKANNISALKIEEDLYGSDDLDNKIMFGSYRCRSDTIAQGLQHSPTQEAFTMAVIPISGGQYVQQIITTISNRMYIRTFLIGTTNTSWKDLITRTKLLTISSIAMQANSWTTIVPAADLPTTASAKIVGITLLGVNVNSTDNYNLMFKVTSSGLQMKASAAQTYSDLVISYAYTG